MEYCTLQKGLTQPHDATSISSTNVRTNSVTDIVIPPVSPVLPRLPVLITPTASPTASPTTSPVNSPITMSVPIDPNKELFDDAPPTMSSLSMGVGGSTLPTAPPPAAAPPSIAGSDSIAADEDDDGPERAVDEGYEGAGGSILHLSVTDPQEIGEGRNRHTFYRIDVRSSEYNTTSDPLSSIRRRYSDFQWLFQRLHAERPGAIIPIIPHQQAMASSKRFSEELVEERRTHLEKFLRGIQVHPELEGASCLSAFFSPDAEVFEAAKRDNPKSDTDEAYEINGSAAENVKEKVKHFFVKTRIKAKVMGGGELEETSDGAAFEEVEQYLNDLEIHMKTLSKATMYLVDVSKETHKNMHELGQTLFGLCQLYDPSKPEGDSDSDNNATNHKPKASMKHIPSLKSISNVFASLSAIHKVKHDENSTKVSHPLLDLEWHLKSARLALKRRKERQITYNTYLQQIKNRSEKLEKLKTQAAVSPGASPEKDAQISNAQKLLDMARYSANAALTDLDAVGQRVLREMDRFKSYVDESLRKIYVAHARVQVEYSRQLDAEWGKLLQPNGVGMSPRVVSPKTSMGSESKDAEVMMI